VLGCLGARLKVWKGNIGYDYTTTRGKMVRCYPMQQPDFGFQVEFMQNVRRYHPVERPLEFHGPI
jgi:hypothetical protein